MYQMVQCSLSQSTALQETQAEAQCNTDHGRRGFAVVQSPIIPNGILLANPCYVNSGTWFWFGFARWTCWNTVSHLFATSVHNLSIPAKLGCTPHAFDIINYCCLLCLTTGLYISSHLVHMHCLGLFHKWFLAVTLCCLFLSCIQLAAIPLTL